MVVSLDTVIGHCSRAGMTDTEWQTVRALRNEFYAAAMCGPFDPRRAPMMEGAELDQWHRRRRMWAAELFAGDLRVAVTP